MKNWRSLAEFFALRRNLVILLIAIFAIGAGEELWMRFIPKYLQALGATVFIIGTFDAIRTLLGAIYAYPGGLVVDRWGFRRAFIAFNVLSIAGYAVVLLVPHWGAVICATFLFLSWTCFSLPATFSLIAETLEANRHSMGIGMQSVIKRLPIMIAPFLGGVLIDRFGMITGVRIGLVVSIVFSAATIGVQRQLRETPSPIAAAIPEQWNFWRSLTSFNSPLRRLLLSDILIRFCERIPFAWVVIYAMDYVGTDAKQVGLLTTIEMLAATLCIIPASHFADKYGREPFVFVTFILFTLFPVAALVIRQLCDARAGLCHPRTEGIWRHVAQGAHHRLQRSATTRANDRHLLFGPRSSRQHRRAGRGAALETRTRRQFRHGHRARSDRQRLLSALAAADLRKRGAGVNVMIPRLHRLTMVQQFTSSSFASRPQARSRASRARLPSGTICSSDGPREEMEPRGSRTTRASLSIDH